MPHEAFRVDCSAPESVDGSSLTPALYSSTLTFHTQISVLTPSSDSRQHSCSSVLPRQFLTRSRTPPRRWSPSHPAEHAHYKPQKQHARLRTAGLLVDVTPSLYQLHNAELPPRTVKSTLTMTLKSLSLVVLIAATAALEVTAQRPDASRHHDSYVQRARMLKKRASSVAAATNDTENPCKRDTTSSSIQVVNAGGAQRAPLRAGWGASSSSDSRQGLSSSSTSSSSSSGTQWSSSSDSAAPSPSASGASDNSQGGMGVVHSWSGDDVSGPVLSHLR